MSKMICHLLLLFSVSFFAQTFAGPSTAFAQKEFRGRGCIITVNSACAARGFKAGDCADVRFTPPNAVGNGNNTRFSIITPNYAMNFKQAGSAVGTTYQTPEFSWVGRGGGIASQSLTKWRIPLVQPANYSLPYVHIVVDFYRFDDFDATDRSFCNTRWRVTAQKWPDPASAIGQASTQLPALDPSASSPVFGGSRP